MMAGVLTDSQLRARWRGEKTRTVPQDTVITPAAMDFLRENNISLSRRSEGMTVEENPGGRYVEAATGRPMAEKTEDMTHLRGNLLVPKTHPRIAFRGKLDSVMADTLLAQCLAREKGCAMAEDGLGEVLQALRAILAAEVKEEPLSPPTLFGLDSDRLRWVSQHIQEEMGMPHPIPEHTMGCLALTINRLRTQIRETELAAAAAFTGEREDLLLALNRLSSAVYILFCRLVAEQTGRFR